METISKGSHWKLWGAEHTLRHHRALRWLLPAELVITAKPEDLVQHYQTEWHFWDVCGWHPTPGTPRGAASLVVWSMERQECRAQAWAGPQ
ncbi:hypothetical protein Nmel_014409, partial [Mimus melanotis]